MGQLRQRAARATRQASVVATVVTAALCAVLLVDGPLVGIDLTRYDVGVLCALRNGFARTAIPWLSPTIGNGAPLVAEVGAALLYPFRWLVLPLPVEWAASLFVALHLALGAGAATWLARTYRVRPVVAALAGIAFALSGPVFDLRLHGPYIVAALYLPASWAAARSALRGQPFGGPCLALFLALTLLGGEPQTFALSVAVALFELALARGRRALDVVMAVVAGTLLGGAQLALSLGENALTRRTQGFPMDEALSGAFDPVLWSAAVLPMTSSMLHPRAAPLIAAALPPGAMKIWSATPYLGVCMLVAFAVGLLRKRARGAAVVGVTALVVSTGATLGVLPILMRVVPLVGSFRYPQKYMPLASLAVVVVASIAWSRIGAVRARQMGAVFAAAGILLVAASGASSNFDATGALRVQIVYALLPVMATVGALAALPKLRRAALLVPLVVVIDLGRASLHEGASGPSVLEVPSVMAHARDPNDVYCTEATLGGVVLPLDAHPTWAAMATAHAFGLPELTSCDGVANGVAYTALQTAFNGELEYALSRGIPDAARALGCTKLLSIVPPAGPGLTPIAAPDVAAMAASTGAPIALYAVESALPPAFVVRGAVRCGSEDCLLDCVYRGPEAPGPIERVVDDPLRRYAGALPDGAGVTSLEATRPQTERATLVARGSGGAVLALRTAFAVGWEARQAGAALPVVRVAGSHVAVVVDDVARGPVELTYVPPRLGLAMAAGSFGLLSLAGLVFRARRNFRQRRS